MARTVTVEQLQAWHACPDQVQLFFETFGDAAVVSPETLGMAATAMLDLRWLARRVLTNAALAEYDRVRAAALAEYDRVRAAELAEYVRVANAAWAEYDRVRAAAIIALFLDGANWKEVDA